jgi:site-specific recombinase XerD
MAPSHAQLAVYDIQSDVGHGLESTDPLKRAIAGWLARYKGQTLLDYTRDFELFLDWCAATRVHPLQVGRGHLELYIRHMENQTNHFTGKPLATSTINNRFGTVAVFYKYAAIDDIIPKNPALAVDRPKIRKEEQKRVGMSPLVHGIFMDAAEKHSPMAHALIALMIRFRGKGDKYAELPLAVPVARAVKTAIGDREVGPILLNERGLRMRRPNAHLLIQKLAAEAVLPADVTPHSFRRAFAMTLLASGADLRDVMIAMRHDKPETTVEYDVRARTPDRDASHQLNAILAGMRG